MADEPEKTDEPTNLRVLSKDDLSSKDGSSNSRWKGARPALKYEVCCRCGVFFAFPVWLEESLRKSQQLFYCPYGHSQFYPK